MQYNMLLKEFGSGQFELRFYDEPICDLTDKEKKRRSDLRKRSIERRLENIENDFYESVEFFETLNDYYYVCGSIGDFQSLLTLDELHLKRDSARFEKSVRDSRRRTINTIHDIARSEKWNMFYTLTFSPEVVDRTDFCACMRKARKWLNHLKSRKASFLKYLFVPELHKDGVSWHLHGLVACDDGILYVDSGHVDKSGNTVFNVPDWKFGFSTATRISDSNKASSYILKYITKELCEKVRGHRYFRSNNITPVIETKINSCELGLERVDDISGLENLLNSLGDFDISRLKKVNTDFCRVTYINGNIHIFEKESENEKTSRG